MEDETAQPQIVRFKSGFIFTSDTSRKVSKPERMERIGKMVGIGKMRKTAKNVGRQEK